MAMEDFAHYLAGKVGSGKLAEIGVGFNFKVALKLRDLGLDVIVIDWNREAVLGARKVGLNAYIDDIFKPNLELYHGVKAIYAVRPTPEIIKPIIALSEKLNVPLYILPFSLDEMPRELKLENYRGLAIYKKG